MDHFRPTRRTALGLIGAACVLPRTALAGGVEALEGRAFGTHWRIVAPAGAGPGGLRPAVEAAFARIDRQFSPWRADSVISGFNGGPAGLHGVEAEVVDLTAAALAIARASEGAFDPTVGPLVARWGFGPIGRGGAPDWRGLSAGPGGLGKVRDDLTLDLCGIAKGRALDVAAALAREAGLCDTLLDLGGELVALGHHPDGRDWHVAVEAPLPGMPAPLALRLPAGMAVATSGTRAQSYALGGRVYSHIVGPDRDAPGAAALSVTVLAEDATAADGWATALCAAGMEAGPALAETHGIAALFLSAGTDGLRDVRTGLISEFVL